jgi:hypothetical protein
MIPEDQSVRRLSPEERKRVEEIIETAGDMIDNGRAEWPLGVAPDVEADLKDDDRCADLRRLRDVEDQSEG